MERKTHRGDPRRVRRSGLVVLAVALFALGGCLQSSTEVGDAPSSSTDEPIPTMDLIRSQVSMSDAQAEALKTPWTAWARAERTRDETPDVSPSLEFLGASAEILDRRQLRTLVGVLAEHRQLRRGDGNGPRADGPHANGRFGRRGHRGGFDGPRDGSGPWADLELTEEQREAIAAERATLHETLQPLRAQLKDGALTREEFHAAASEARETFHAAVLEILTPEQRAQLEQKQRERMIEQLERRLSRDDARSARRLELLAKILGLDEAQVEAIDAVHVEAAAQRTAVLNALRDGSMTPADARAELRNVREATHAAVVAELTEEQAELLEQLRAMHPRGRRHGPRG